MTQAVIIISGFVIVQIIIIYYTITMKSNYINDIISKKFNF
jgi:hypothetical protein